MTALVKSFFFELANGLPAVCFTILMIKMNYLSLNYKDVINHLGIRACLISFSFITHDKICLFKKILLANVCVLMREEITPK